VSGSSAPISLGSWLLALLLILCSFTVLEGQRLNATDLNSATVTSLIMTALLFSLAYAPSLSWLRKRLGGVFQVIEPDDINDPGFFYRGDNPSRVG